MVNQRTFRLLSSLLLVTSIPCVLRFTTHNVLNQKHHSKDREMATSYPPSPNPLQPPERDELVDKSEALFTMYLERADDDDNKTTEKWKKECEVILIFTGLFSAALAALLAVSVLDIRPSPQDTTATYVANIYHLLANSTTSQPIILPRPLDPPKFSPPKYAVLVNALWFLSLVMSLTGALLAVFVQQWIASYSRATQDRRSPQERVKIHVFFAEGLDKWHVSFIVRIVPVLVHISLFLFFSGLLIWLLRIDLAVFLPTAIWLGICGVGYGGVTLIPIIYHDCPYDSPLSSSLRRILMFAKTFIPKLCDACLSFAPPSLSHLGPGTQGTDRDELTRRLLSMREARVKTALDVPIAVNYRAFLWTFESLKRDDELERFYGAIPDFCASLGDPLGGFIRPNKDKLSRALAGMMDRTFSSVLVPESVKQRRIQICMEAVRATKQDLMGHWYFLYHVLMKGWQDFLGYAPFGRLVQDWQDDITEPATNLFAQCVVSAVVATALEPGKPWDELVRCHQPWIRLARRHLNVSDDILQGYLTSTQGHTLLLANLNCIVSHITQFDLQAVSPPSQVFVLESLKALESMCKFDITGTSAPLQHRFCHLWNQLVRNMGDPRLTDLSTKALQHICKIHTTLHGGAPPTVAPSSAVYTECTVNGPPSAQSVPIPPTTTTASGPAGNSTYSAASPTTSAPHAHLQTQMTPTTAGPSSHASASTYNNNVVMPSNASSTSLPVSVSSTTTPHSAPVATRVITPQPSSNLRNALQTSPSLANMSTLHGQAPQPP